ncbi:MAG: hypothetical protein NkDv07_0285 [Candidatus Improbicoccus devescovinae]|nr:MAG: hypothetical protein NkDv07_0285 [Candidatus Improbicoccus devescovinae]
MRNKKIYQKILAIMAVAGVLMSRGTARILAYKPAAEWGCSIRTDKDMLGGVGLSAGNTVKTEGCAGLCWEAWFSADGQLDYWHRIYDYGEIPQDGIAIIFREIISDTCPEYKMQHFATVMGYEKMTADEIKRAVLASFYIPDQSGFLYDQPPDLKCAVRDVEPFDGARDIDGDEVVSEVADKPYVIVARTDAELGPTRNT